MNYNFRYIFCVFKKEISWRKEVDLLFFLGISYVVELFYIKDNYINEIFSVFVIRKYFIL